MRGAFASPFMCSPSLRKSTETATATVPSFPAVYTRRIDDVRSSSVYTFDGMWALAVAKASESHCAAVSFAMCVDPKSDGTNRATQRTNYIKDWRT